MVAGCWVAVPAYSRVYDRSHRYCTEPEGSGVLVGAGLPREWAAKRPHQYQVRNRATSPFKSTANRDSSALAALV